MLSYIVGIGCSAVLAGVTAFMFINDNSNVESKNTKYESESWPDDNCCHYEGEF